MIYKPTPGKWAENKYHKWCARHFSDYPRIRDILIDIGPHNDLPVVDSDRGEGLFIYGELKSGKTILAAQLAMQEQKKLYLLQENKTILFVKVPQLLHRIKATYREGAAEREEEILNKLQNTHLLVLDEFGMSKASDWLLELLYLIVDHRYENKKPTIYTSNYDLATLSENLQDDRIPSRIERTCRIIKKKPWKPQHL